MIRPATISLVLLLGLSSAGWTLAASPARQVQIESEYMGMSPDDSARTRLLIERQGNNYRVTGTTGQLDHPKRLPPTPVDAAKVANLIDAMVQPSQDQISLAWATSLQAQTRKAIHGKSYGLSRRYPLPRQQLLIDAVVDDPTRLRTALTLGFRQAFHTDDYPRITITARLVDGTVITAHSRSQHVGMLPWERSPGGTTFATDIPRALVALLPPEATNVDRIDLAPRDGDLDEIMNIVLYQRLGRISAETLAATALRALEERYRVDELSVVTRKDSRGPVLLATLHWQAKDIDFALVEALLLRNGVLIHGENEIRRIDHDFAIAQLSRPLMIALQRLPADKRQVRLWSLNSHYISSNKPLFNFMQKEILDAMKKRNLWPDVVRRPELLLQGVRAHVGEDPATWFVLPDGRTMRY